MRQGREQYVLNSSTKQDGPTARCPYAPSYAISDDDDDDDDDF